MEKYKLDLIRVASALMVFAAITYTVCYVWHGLARSPFTDGLFAAAFPGFSWSVIGFVTGLGWSFAYSAYVAVVFVPVYNLCCRVGTQPNQRRIRR
ncbi:hypothetical protein [Mycobacterium sp. 155]|uniref:hypothetical protein n=1 Tax=Mycobacterium sp. 155 TaxID=1157943 RepID=UPI00036464BD|nr:hypothetical protein [Mycobacterium sp. 155]